MVLYSMYTAVFNIGLIIFFWPIYNKERNKSQDFFKEWAFFLGQPTWYPVCDLV